MNTYPTYYEVIWNYEEKECHEAGIIFTQNYAEAAAYIEEYYGEDLISIEKIVQFDTTALIFKDPSKGREILKTMEENIW